MQVRGLARTSWPISRILFPAAAAEQRRRGGDHPSGHTVTGCLERPTRRLGRATLGRLRGRTFVRPSWPCFGWGLPSHSGHPECWCALTAPFHPYHREGGGLFSVALSRESPRIAVSNHPALRSPDFPRLDPGLSDRSEPRPPGQLVRTHTVLAAESAGQRRLPITQYSNRCLNAEVGVTLTA